jgi:NAD(P)-dependent dehydrogenase (short-subunit alcohol dehydrogenase family)
MIERGSGGTIINVASIAALVGGNPDYMQTVGYNASKGAVISMTRDLATSWAKHDITVNAIAPGWFHTRMSGDLIEEFEEQMLEDIPLRRFGTPRGPERGRRLPRLTRRLHNRPDDRRGRRRHRLVVTSLHASGSELSQGRPTKLGLFGGVFEDRTLRS